MPEPDLHCPNIDARTQPACCGGIAKTVQVPFVLVESGFRRNLLAPLVQKSVVEMALRRRKHQLAARNVRVLSENLSDFGGEGDGALFPILREEPVLWFCGHMDPVMHEIQVRPVECLHFPATKARCEYEAEERLFPVVADSKEFLEFGIWVGDRAFSELWKARHVFERVVDAELVEEVVQDDPVRVEGRAGIKSLGLPPSEEFL